MNSLLGIGLLVALGLGVHLMASLRARMLLRGPSPFSTDELERVPSGRVETIVCADGTRLWAVVAGVGPTVVFAHGYGLSMRTWSLVWPRLLAAGYRVIAFDHRGHGRSTIGRSGVRLSVMADDMLEVIEHFDVCDGIVVGHSLGGLLALRMSADHPEIVRRRVRRLVLIGAGAGHLARRAPQFRLQAPLLRSGLLEVMANTPPYRWLIASAVFGRVPAPESMRAFVNDYWAQDQHGLLDLLSDLVHESDYDRLYVVPVPCVLLFGASDRVVPRWHFDALRRGLPRSLVVELPSVGHMVPWEHPQAIIEAVEASANRAATGTAGVEDKPTRGPDAPPTTAQPR